MNDELKVLGSYSTVLHDKLNELRMLGDLLQGYDTEIPLERNCVYEVGEAIQSLRLFILVLDKVYQGWEISELHDEGKAESFRAFIKERLKDNKKVLELIERKKSELDVEQEEHDDQEDE